MDTKSSYPNFRKIARYEGISYLLLLFVAMPLKYLFSIPIAVTIVGSIHGFLFILFVIWMYIVYDAYGHNLKWVIKAFLSSIIPFGTFIMDKEWQTEQESQ